MRPEGSGFLEGFPAQGSLEDGLEETRMDMEGGRAGEGLLGKSKWKMQSYSSFCQAERSEVEVRGER